jgi:outer membrane protein assembly factor BamB
VYYGDNGGTVYALNGTTGHPVWTFRTGAAVHSSPVLSRNQQTVFVGSHDTRLYALDARSGQVVW